MANPMTLERTEDVVRAATQVWQDANENHGTGYTLTFHDMCISVSYCSVHNVIEVTLASPAEVIGMQDVYSSNDIARILDAVLCIDTLCRNLADEVLSRLHTIVKTA